MAKNVADKKAELGVYQAFVDNNTFKNGKVDLEMDGEEARKLPTGKTDRRSKG
jgi:hypothetical protein